MKTNLSPTKKTVSDLEYRMIDMEMSAKAARHQMHKLEQRIWAAIYVAIWAGTTAVIAFAKTFAP